MRTPRQLVRLPNRPLALILAFGALVLLLVGTAATTQAFVAKKGHTTLDDFAAGEFHRTALLDLPFEGIDSVQLVPVGLFGTWTADAQTLPIPVTEGSVVAGGGKIVVMGGFDTDFNTRSEVYVSNIGSGGPLSPWVEQTQAPLPQPLSAAAAAISPGAPGESYIYLLGGIGSGDSLGTVYHSTLNHSTGQLTSWTVVGSPLPTPAHYLAAVAHQGYLYVLGGYSVVSPFFPYTLDTVYYAEILGDGSLGSWTAAPDLPEPLSSHVVLGYSEGITNTLYALGGGARPGLPFNASFHVYFADVNPDGSLSPWQLSQGNLPSKIYAHGGAMVSDQIFVTGGRDANNTISDTVKAALVDSADPDFRLYDWCLGVPPPICTIGAWQSGPLLPVPRAFHATVNQGVYVYTVGGVDGSGQPTGIVYRGSATEPGAFYSPKGYYLSPDIDFEQPADLLKLKWDTAMAFPAQQSLSVRYRYKKQLGDWQPWSAPVYSVHGENELDITPTITNVRHVQYRIDMTTGISTSSPLLNWLDVFYEVSDPEVAVSKDTGEVISVTADMPLEYTIYYTNSGNWVAEGVMISETLPAYSTYAGGPAWQQVGSTDVYTHLVGDLARGANGQTSFQVQIDPLVPASERFFTNSLEIDYPPMTDAFSQIITDPEPENNYFEFINPFLPYAITITKDAEPAPASFVYPGRLITYRLTYSNEVGATFVSNASIVDQVPGSTTYVPGSIYGTGADDSNPAELRWNLGTVFADTYEEVGYVARVIDTTQTGVIMTNTATIFSDNGDPISSTITHSVVLPYYKLWTTKHASPPPGTEVEPGSLISYTIFYTNSGNGVAVDAVLTDHFDAPRTYSIVSADPPPDVGDNVWRLGTLDPIEKGEINVTIELNDVLPSKWLVTNDLTLASPSGADWHTPLVTHVVTNPGMALPDLIIEGFWLEPSAPAEGEPLDIHAVISNAGTLNAGTYFWVSVYFKPAPGDPPEGPSDHDMGYCLNNCTTLRPQHLYYVDRLAVGESKEIVFMSVPGQELSFPADGFYDVYVQIDMAFDDPHYNEYWGVHVEANEYNNILHKRVIIGASRTIYLPLIFRYGP